MNFNNFSPEELALFQGVPISSSTPLPTPAEEEKENNEGGVSVKSLDEKEEKLIWKLFKGKTVLMFRLCGNCLSKLYYNKTKWARSGDGIDVNFHLCPLCVRVNCYATNLLAPPTKKKVDEKTE